MSNGTQNHILTLLISQPQIRGWTTDDDYSEWTAVLGSKRNEREKRKGQGAT